MNQEEYDISFSEARGEQYQETLELSEEILNVIHSLSVNTILPSLSHVLYTVHYNTLKDGISLDKFMDIIKNAVLQIASENEKRRDMFKKA